MSENLIQISSRGTLTLPKGMRKKLAAQGNAPTLFQVELTPEGVLLKPMLALPMRNFSEAQLGDWVKEDEDTARKLKLWDK